MQNNFYVLRQLAKQFAIVLKDKYLGSCFTQLKDELILGFYDQNSEFFIKASLSPEICCLSFTQDFSRAKRNTVNLLPELLDKKIVEVKIFENDRSLGIFFEQNLCLVFKMHGIKSNILVFENGKVINLFRKNFKKDQTLLLENLDRKITQTEDFFFENGIQKTFPTFDKNILRQIDFLQSTANQWLQIQFLLDYFENPTYYVVFKDGKAQFSLFADGEVLFESNTIFQALNEFFYTFVKTYYLDTTKNIFLKFLENRKQQTESYLEKTLQKIEDLENESPYEQTADIIMANLHAIPQKVQEIELFDFYHDRPITIRLKEHLSPQKNAEIYYKKAKNRKLEIQKNYENLAYKEQQLEKINTQIADIQAFEHLKDLKKYLKESGLEKEQSQKADFPFKRFEQDGFEIWIGKNAQNNDTLTQKYAHKEDIWLHARNVAGSHVLIKYQSGRKIPMQVVERAAQLAAYFSQAKTETLCAVIFTPRKYIRKPKGALAGQVIVEKEEVIMVEPRLD